MVCGTFEKDPRYTYEIDDEEDYDYNDVEIDDEITVGYDEENVSDEEEEIADDENVFVYSEVSDVFKSSDDKEFEEEEEEYVVSEALADAEDMLNNCEEETRERFFWVSVNDIVLDRFNEEEIHYRIDEKRFWYSVINHFFEDEKEYTGGISSDDFIDCWRYYLQMI